MVALCGIDCIDAVKIHSLFFMKSNMKINPGFSVRPVKCRKYPQFNSDLTHFQQQKSLCQEVPLPKVTGVLEWVHTQHKTPPFKPQNTNLPETDHGPPKKCFFMELPSHPSLWDRPRNCYVSGDDRIGLPRVYLYTIIWHKPQSYTLSDQSTSWCNNQITSQIKALLPLLLGRSVTFEESSRSLG